MKKKDKFWEIAAKNAEEVKKWPKWKQRLVINAKNASTGNFYEKQN